ALLGKLSRWFERSPLPEPEQLQALFLASPKDEAANQLAREWSKRYRESDEAQRHSMLSALGKAGTEAGLTEESAMRLFRRLYAQSDSLELMVQLRADLLRWRKQDVGLSGLEHTLASLLSHWLDVRMHELLSINRNSPAALPERSM